LQPGKVVILLTGRFAGKKAVIVKNNDEGAAGRSYGHAVVVGLAREPRKIIKRSSQKKQDKKSRVKTFIKTVNYQHLMPTRYTLEADLKGVVTAEAQENPTKKKESRKEASKIFEEKFKTGKSRWFFSKLRF